MTRAHEPVSSSTHCCEVMATNAALQCSGSCTDVYECSDTLVSFIAKYQEYGLIIHDGGTSSVEISFCPWCGQRLPESRREQWLAELERRGIDPRSDEIPRELTDHRWLRTQTGLSHRPRNEPKKNRDVTGFRRIDPLLT